MAKVMLGLRSEKLSRNRILKLAWLPIVTLLYCHSAEGAITGTGDEPTQCKAGQPAKQTIEGCTKVLSLPDIDQSTRAYALLLRGNAYAGMNELDLAAADYESLQKIQYSPNVTFALGSIYVNRGRSEDAIKQFSTLVDAGVATAQVFNARGAAYQNAGQYEASIADFNKALLLNPADLTALNNRAAAYSKMGDDQAALKDFDAILERDPNMPMALVNRCDLLTKTVDIAKGLPSCQKAEHLAPDNWMVISAIGVAYYYGKQFDEAIKYYNRSLRLLPNYAAAVYLRGMANSKLGKDEESKADFSEAERIQPGIGAMIAKTGIK